MPLKEADEDRMPSIAASGITPNPTEMGSEGSEKKSYFLGAFFLPATVRLTPPRRVRLLVRVR
jgi:hypothetical protein